MIFNGDQDIELWLGDRGRKAALLIASRSALRLIPKLAEIEPAEEFINTAFRCASVTWATLLFPAQVSDSQGLAAARDAHRFSIGQSLALNKRYPNLSTLPDVFAYAASTSASTFGPAADSYAAATVSLASIYD